MSTRFNLGGTDGSNDVQSRKISHFCATEKAASKNRKMRRHLSHKNCCKSASRLSVVGNVVALVLAATSMHCPRHDFVLYVTLHNSLTHLFLKHPLVSFSDLLKSLGFGIS